MATSLLLLLPVACGSNSHANNGGKGGSAGHGGAGGATGRGGSGGVGGSTSTGGRGGGSGGVSGSGGAGGVAGSAGGAGGSAGGAGGATAGSGGGTAGSAGGTAGGAGGTAGGAGGTAGGAGGAGGTAGAGGANGGTSGAGGATGGTSGVAGATGGTTSGAGGATGGSSGAGGASGGTSGAGGATGGTTGGAGGATGGTSGAGGASGGTSGAGGSAGGTSGTGGSTDAGPNCALPPTDAGTPGPMPDNVMFLPNVTVSTIAGGGTPGTTNGPLGTGLLSNPVSVAIEPSGTLAITDFDSDRLRRAVVADGTLSTLTMQVGFTRPFGLVIANGVLYAQTDNTPSNQHSPNSGTIWRVDAVSGVATAVGVSIGRPRGVAALSDGRLALADFLNQRVRIFDPGTGAVAELAGTQGCSGSANGTGPDARFVTPLGIAVLAGNRIIVADRDAHILREVSLAGVVTTFAGDGVAGTIDGPVAGVRFNQPAALATDAAGDVFVSDYGAHRIRRIAANGTVRTVAGDGTGGFMDGPGNTAELYGQEGIAVSADGATIYVADGTLGGEPPGPYNRIRKITIAP